MCTTWTDSQMYIEEYIDKGVIIIYNFVTFQCELLKYEPVQVSSKLLNEENKAKGHDF